MHLTNQRHGNGSAVSFEQLESRTLLSGGSAPGKGGGSPPPAPAPSPAIRLDLVALHEFGHALGLDHSSDKNSIMYAYYNANYDRTKFASDSAVATFRSLYSSTKVGASTTAWKDSLDGTPGNARVDITYSFILDGAATDKGASNIFASFDAKFGAGAWEPVFINALNRWASVSNGTVAFQPFDGAGDPDPGIEDGLYAFGSTGSVQRDARFGDIRIGTHRFDGAGKTLAHTYYPPPNGGTAAGDAHFDYAENWSTGASSTTSSTTLAAASSSSKETSAKVKLSSRVFSATLLGADAIDLLA